MVMTGLKSSSIISGDNQASPLTGAIWQNESILRATLEVMDDLRQIGSRRSSRQ